MPDILALIPARGGSKGIPRKNLIELAGKPLIAHSIEHALHSSRITRVIVSTDDEEIAEVARRYGAEVPFLRPAALSGDLSTDLEVFEHALEHLQGQEGYVPELVVQLRPTSPVRKVNVVDAAIDALLAAPSADSLKSLSPSKASPYKMWVVDAGGAVPLLELPGLREAHSMPRQILPTVYAGNGYVDIIRPRAILEQKSMVGRVVLPFVLDEPIFDLDYPEQIRALEEALYARVGITPSKIPARAARG
jgi:CMP-N,N'-diacetyllegionaminic acid synthase